MYRYNSTLLSMTMQEDLLEFFYFFDFLDFFKKCRNPPSPYCSILDPRVILLMEIFNFFAMVLCGVPLASSCTSCQRSATEASSCGVRMSFRSFSASFSFRMEAKS